ncbi:MAG: electron transport complex subunit RsxG [Gammaproteobacteria bacterium]
MDETDPKIFPAVASIAAIATVAALLVSGSYELSRDRIEVNRQEQLLQSLHELVDAASYDNELTASRMSVIDVELLGTAEPVDVFIATQNGQPVAAIFSSIAPRGYIGPISLLVGISADAVVTGVRVTDHRETPGLGDAIDLDKSNWILGFTGTSLSAPEIGEWFVQADGGEFDSITGATVTPRAVVKSVRDTLLYFERNRETLFSNYLGTVDE